MTDNEEIKEKTLPTQYSVMYAIQFEKIMKVNNIEIKLIPVPRSISSSCGMCGKFNINIKDTIMNICHTNNILYDGIYEQDGF